MLYDVPECNWHPVIHLFLDEAKETPLDCVLMERNIILFEYVLDMDPIYV